MIITIITIIIITTTIIIIIINNNTYIEYSTIKEDNVIRNSQDIKECTSILMEDDLKGPLTISYDRFPLDVIWKGELLVFEAKSDQDKLQA